MKSPWGRLLPELRVGSSFLLLDCPVKVYQVLVRRASAHVKVLEIVWKKRRSGEYVLGESQIIRGVEPETLK
jgi:hypothetical protein